MDKPILDYVHTAIVKKIAGQLSIKTIQVEAVLELLKEGATIPFISRYRKDKTGGLDEVQILQIEETNKDLTELEDRRDFIEKTIAEQGKMTPELLESIKAAETLPELEDLYLPYKPKRKTRATTARENGLEPLALTLLEQKNIDLNELATTFLNEKVTDIEEALQGARDIVAEMANEDSETRARLRGLFEKEAIFHYKVVPEKEKEAIKYKDYFDNKEPINKMPSHRVLAVLRGFMEGFLRISIEPPVENAMAILEDKFVKPGQNPCIEQIKMAVEDAYSRLLQPSLETESKTAAKNKADEEAISVFAENLRQLLLSPPLGNKRLMAIDPGYRTGCKVVCLDEKGDLLINDLIYVHEEYKKEQSAQTVRTLVEKYSIAAFAIGDGTAGRETEAFIKQLGLGLPIFLVNEDGASVYSASAVAREEFPDYDVTVRGSVSIGRRLMDPLAELVKIDPKSIGVGQYQHDVNATRLREKLDHTVVSCVNQVGVNVNTASKHLLGYVSGIGPSLAENIVTYRKEKGKFTNRKQLMEVHRLGAKAYEQCAGFLRIKDGDNPLDASAVHPEAYKVVEKMSKDLNIEIHLLIGNGTVLKELAVANYITQEIGEMAIRDILNELKKPGIDPRNNLEVFEYAAIYSIEDVHVGMIVPGMVTNITRFGAFVDIGVKQDGLVHVSEIANRFIKDPSEALKLNDKVKVKVLEVDIPRKRINLSIKQCEAQPQAAPQPQRMPKFPKREREVREVIQQPKVEAEPSLEDALAGLKKKFAK